MSRSEEDAETVGRRDACGTFLLVDERWGSSQRSAGDGCDPSGRERFFRIGGSADDILFRRDLAERYGGVGGRGWPTTRGFVVIVVGYGRVWEIRAMGGVRSIVRRSGGVYHSRTDDQTGVDKKKKRELGCNLGSLYSLSLSPAVDKSG